MGRRRNVRTWACIRACCVTVWLLIHPTGEALRRLAQLCERGALSTATSYQDPSYCALQITSAYLLRTTARREAAVLAVVKRHVPVLSWSERGSESLSAVYYIHLSSHAFYAPSGAFYLCKCDESLTLGDAVSLYACVSVWSMCELLFPPADEFPFCRMFDNVFSFSLSFA